MAAGGFTRDQAIAAIGYGKPGFNPRRVRERLAVFTESIAHNERGVALAREGRSNEAVAAYSQATKLRPDFAQAHTNNGRALTDLGRIDESIAAHRRAVAHWPDDSIAHFGLADALLMAGEYTEGLTEYEWRWKGTAPVFKRKFAEPRWSGEYLNGRTLLIHAEQGFGDAIQFVRFAPELARFNGRVLLEAPRALVPLLHSAPGFEDVVAADDPLPNFDAQIPLMSLPHVLGTRLDTIPTRTPYLQSDPVRTSVWRERLSPYGGLKVGVVWAGNPEHTHDHWRSIQASKLLPHLTMPGVQLFGLQVGMRAGDREVVDATPGMIDLSPQLSDFANSAAAVDALDLVISVDTSVAHLAGAIGVPVWTLIPFSLDWRWMLGREDSPWYPTMRLFRQSRPGDWTTVLERVGTAIATLQRERSAN